MIRLTDADGRYYLYYVDSKRSIVSVAVCDTPAGLYRFLGYVKYADGTLLGNRQGDEPQFDPGVLTEGERTYLYTGFCSIGDESRSGAMATVLGPDMLTIIEEPVFVAPSIRKKGDLYYFIYSSMLMHELCYATSTHLTKGVSESTPMAYNGNNHGSMVEINNQRYIFYYRHTNGTNFSRQAVWNQFLCKKMAPSIKWN